MTNGEDPAGVFASPHVCVAEGVLPGLAGASALLGRFGQHDCDVLVPSHRQQSQIELIEPVLNEAAEPHRFVCWLGDPARGRDQKVVGQQRCERGQILLLQCTQERVLGLEEFIAAHATASIGTRRAADNAGTPDFVTE